MSQFRIEVKRISKDALERCCDFLKNKFEAETVVYFAYQRQHSTDAHFFIFDHRSDNFRHAVLENTHGIENPFDIQNNLVAAYEWGRSEWTIHFDWWIKEREWFFFEKDDVRFGASAYSITVRS